MQIENAMRARMRAGDLAVGMIVRLVRGVEIVAIARTAGFDCLMIDLEHNGFSHETATQLCLSAAIAGVTPLVRVASFDPVQIAQALDCGAHGVIVPEIETADQARAAVQAARFPPLGRRSVMPCQPQLGFRPMANAPAMQAVNEGTLLVSMIESPTALENVEEIARVPGLDMLLVGANDLANALGLSGKTDHPDVLAAFARVAAACKAAGKFFGVGGLGQKPEIARDMVALGASYVTAGADVTFFVNAAIAQVAKFR
jgi:2-keto-3-deoxy-L-rhamnonate aldolase RhmA